MASLPGWVLRFTSKLNHIARRVFRERAHPGRRQPPGPACALGALRGHCDPAAEAAYLKECDETSPRVLCLASVQGDGKLVDDLGMRSCDG